MSLSISCPPARNSHPCLPNPKTSLPAFRKKEKILGKIPSSQTPHDMTVYHHIRPISGFSFRPRRSADVARGDFCLSMRVPVSSSSQPACANNNDSEIIHPTQRAEQEQPCNIIIEWSQFVGQSSLLLVLGVDFVPTARILMDKIKRQSRFVSATMCTADRPRMRPGHKTANRMNCWTNHKKKKTKHCGRVRLRRGAGVYQV